MAQVTNDLQKVSKYLFSFILVPCEQTANTKSESKHKGFIRLWIRPAAAKGQELFQL